MSTWMSSPFGFDQLVAPNTTWFPTVVNYQGNPVIERRITEEIASFGRQIGIISEALIEVAGKEENGPKLARLRKIVHDIEALKARQHVSLMDETTRTFEALVNEDPHKARRLVETLSNMVAPAARRQR